MNAPYAPTVNNKGQRAKVVVGVCKAGSSMFTVTCRRWEDGVQRSVVYKEKAEGGTYIQLLEKDLEELVYFIRNNQPLSK